LLGAGNLQAFLAESLLLTRKEIWKDGGSSRIRGKQAGNDALALGDLDFLAVAEEAFDSGESVAQVADGSFLHVIHFSITQYERQAILNAKAKRKDTPSKNGDGGTRGMAHRPSRQTEGQPPARMGSGQSTDWAW
jgi:hypothetical protein